MFSEPQPLDRKILDCSQGVARTFTRKIYDENAYAIIGFTGNEKLTVEISSGNDGVVREDDSTLVAVWSQPSIGEYQIQLPELDLGQGIYSIRVLIDPNGEACWPSVREIFRGFIRVSPSPSNGHVGCLKLYCDYSDMLMLAPYLESTHTDNDLSGFSRQRYRARIWVDTCILRCSSNTSFYGVNAVFYGLTSPAASGSSYVDQLLKDDKLIVSPEIMDAAAHYALFLITDSLSSTPTTGSYQEIAQKHYRRANSIMQSSVASFDLNGNGYPSYVVDLRMADGRTTS